MRISDWSSDVCSSDLATSQMSKGHDPWTKADFATKAPGLDWEAFWAAAELPNQQDFIVWQPKAVTGEAALVASEPLQAWQDWLTFHRINTVASVLPKAIDDAHFAFYGTTLSGTPQQRSRDKRAIAAVNNAMGDAVIGRASCRARDVSTCKSRGAADKYK